ncbi:MAG: acylglycerol kinase family protein [Cyclobacteriaceae bacterium]
MKVSCIVHGKKELRHLTAQLQNTDRIKWEFLTTTREKTATKLTLDAISQGADRIMAVGGDGTWNEVINGTLTSSRPDTPCLLYPSGTANDKDFFQINFEKSIPVKCGLYHRWVKRKAGFLSISRMPAWALK